MCKGYYFEAKLTKDFHYVLANAIQYHLNGIFNVINIFIYYRVTVTPSISYLYLTLIFLLFFLYFISLVI